VIHPTSTLFSENLVFVIDDDASMRSAIEDLLLSVSLDVRVFGSIDEFLKSARPEAPSCLVLDIRMPGMSGLEFQRIMAEQGIQLPVIFITAHGDIPMSVQAMKAGAVDFLTKPFRDQDLIDAIQAALEADRQRRLREQEFSRLQELVATLSQGEKEVLNLVAQGMLNKQIAARLNVSEITIKVRRSQLKKKLQVSSVAGLARIADKIDGL